jgi:hypothetical protein
MFFRRDKFSEDETTLLQRVANWPEHATVENLTAETLRQISQQEGIDFATALLFDRFQESPRHAEFIQRINTLRNHPSLLKIAIDAKVVVVPGALYAERPDLGGGGRLVQEVVARLGWSYDFIPLASTGSIAENAQRIRKWLAQHSGEKIILVSLSKGGADLKMALDAPDAPTLFRDVVAWVNVCGPLNGSRMANWVLANRLRTYFFRAQFWLQKRDFKFITDLRYDLSAPLDFRPCPPPAMKILNLVGFPLRRHMTSPFSRFCHRTLSAYGPNDGTILLSDLCAWPGEIYPAWGMDHYFRPQKAAVNLITAVLRYLAEDCFAFPQEAESSSGFVSSLVFTSAKNKLPA